MSKIGLWGVLGTLALVMVGGLIGFLWLPSVARAPGQSLFGAWCSAFGVPGNWASSLQVVPPGLSSEVVLRHDLFTKAQESDPHAGAVLAQRCMMCHGPTGKTYADAPELAGQYEVFIYKELRDFKSGIRSSLIMTGMVAALSDAEMHALAVYYASLPRPAALALTDAAPAVVKWGAPMRNVAPCGSCHGDIDHTMASPWLEGESKQYIRTQLTAFASGQRHNDIDGQMRAMAQGLRPEEIEQAADYYSGKSDHRASSARD